MKYIYILLLTIVPSIVLLSIILYSDRKSREPLYLISFCLLSGLFTISLSLILGKIIMPNTSFLMNNFKNIDLTKTIIFASIEEYCKLLVLYLFISHNKYFDDIYDGFVYSSFIALSFALIETIIYVFSQDSFINMSHLAVVRNFTSIPLHLVCGIIMGHYVALEKFSKTKKVKLFKIIESLLIPVLLHTTYNFFFVYYASKISTSSYLLLIFIFVMLFVYILGIVYIIITKRLNNIFINNKDYGKYYKFLYTKEEYEKLGGD